MPPKPHRTLIDRVSGYADEAAAYLRRRRLNRQPFARVQVTGGRVIACDAATPESRELFTAAASVLDAAR